MSKRFPVCFILPPYLMEKLLESKDKDDRQVALNTMLTSAMLRGERTVQAFFAGAAATGQGRRTISDCQTGTDLPSADVVRTEDGPAASDESANRAFDGFGVTRDFYKQVFDRNSIDGQGMRLDGYIHYGSRYNNAFWDGAEMVFGDGDGVRFTDFTKSLDVIAHDPMMAERSVLKLINDAHRDIELVLGSRRRLPRSPRMCASAPST